MTPDETSRAQRDLEAIDRLSRNSDFTGYFLRRLNELIGARESLILGPNFSETEFPKAKAALAELYSVRMLMDADAAGCRSLLGLERDEIPWGG
jgi:hypothetical protein